MTSAIGAEARPSQTAVTVRSQATRPRAAGRFLWLGGQKLYARGVTYGTFRPDEEGYEYRQSLIERDFAAMAANGVNAVRTYTVPPRWLLDSAERHGLRVMVGLPWEQHVDFLADRRRARSIEHRVRAGVCACAGHPAVLCYAVGNEIPAGIVRWCGHRRVERFLERLFQAAKEEDPEGLVTYVNYPSTEYLELPFLDVVSFNVYLESQDRLGAYLARLHNLAGDRPLLLAEVGLDSRRHGEEQQAATLEWQIQTAFAAGCAGVFVFSWTDEWHRGGHDIDDWDFGLTTRARQPKPALQRVARAFTEVPFSSAIAWPRISVVVCTYNGARVIRDCLEGLQRLEYPDFEVIVVDDGSTDATAAIASEYGVRLIRQENQGLGAARNAGWQAATGEIIAYTDDDARPDPHWLTYLAATYLRTDHVGVGGPNIAPPGDGPIAECVANAPGGPLHVLLTDELAEHIPGCNSSFRRDCLAAVGGYDPQFRVAGDDVDICWRLQERGWTIGFNPAAMVWHHRRNSVRTYWKQQQGYGKAEALLERKWPERYNAAGHVAWGGRLYGKGLTQVLSGRRGRIYQGTWGTAPFQSLYQPQTGLLASLPLMPEWWFVVAVLAGLSLLGLAWPPLRVAALLLAIGLAAPITQALVSASRASFVGVETSLVDLLKRRALTTALHLMQPVARLRGRIRFGLTPWRVHGQSAFSMPWPRTIAAWSEFWRAPETWLGDIETRLRQAGAIVRRGGDFDRWDLEVRGSLAGGSRLLMAIEEHGGGKQLAWFRVSPRWSIAAVATVFGFGTLAAIAAHDSPVTASTLIVAAVLVVVRGVWESGTAIGAVLKALPIGDDGRRDDAAHLGEGSG
jgi:GT2 family glycosyltransferase